MMTGTQAKLSAGLFLFFWVSGCWAETFVGSVKTIDGNPVVIRGDAEIRAVPGLHLLEKDLLRTDAQSRVGFILRDGARVSMGPASELRIEEFAFNPSRGETRSLLYLLRGVAAFVSGKIAKFSPQSAEVQTPVAMIGLRGTRFAIALAKE